MNLRITAAAMCIALATGLGLTTPTAALAASTPGEGSTVVRRVSGTWEALLISSESPCSLVKKGLARYGAPPSIFADFRAANFG